MSAAKWHGHNRTPGALPAVVSAWRALGLTDAIIARAVDRSTAVVSTWVKGKTRLPPTEGLALAITVHALASNSKLNGGAARGLVWVRRNAMSCDVALNWVQLAFQEIFERAPAGRSRAMLDAAVARARVLIPRVDLEAGRELFEREPDLVEIFRELEPEIIAQFEAQIAAIGAESARR